MHMLAILAPGLPRLSACVVCGATLLGMTFFSDLAEANDPTVFHSHNKAGKLFFIQSGAKVTLERRLMRR